MSQQTTVRIDKWLRKDHRNRRIIIECCEHTEKIIFARLEKRSERQGWTSGLLEFSTVTSSHALSELENLLRSELSKKGAAPQGPPETPSSD